MINFLAKRILKLQVSNINRLVTYRVGVLKRHITTLSKISFYLFFACLSITSAWAARPEFIITIKDHLFYPARLVIPENTKVRLVIVNQDNTPEQFDSFDLNREKVIFAGKKSVVYVGPLSAGNYHFFGEYHPNSARGVVIVSNKNSKKEVVNVN